MNSPATLKAAFASPNASGIAWL